MTLDGFCSGSGLSLFKEQKLLELESSVSYKNGTLLNKYLPVGYCQFEYSKLK